MKKRTPWLMGALFSSLTLAAETPLEFDDWVEIPNQFATCRGYYQEPLYPLPDNPSIDSKLPLQINADSSSFTMDGLSTLEGDVHILHGNRTLRADKTTVYRDEQGRVDHITAEGGIRFTEPGLRIMGNTVEVNLGQGMTEVTGVSYRYYLRHARGQAGLARVNNHNHVILKDATYTTCAPGHMGWELSASEVQLDREAGQGTAKGAKLTMAGLPVAYWPYLRFPIDDRRKTGFLFPQFGNSQRSGLILGLPFYWNIAPNADLTLTPTLLTKRGVDFKNNLRYLFKNSQGDLKFTWLPNDKAYRAYKLVKLASNHGYNTLDPRLTGLRGSNTRRSIAWKHSTHVGPHLKGFINFNEVADDNHFVDLGNGLASNATNSLVQEARLNYDGRLVHSFVRYQEYQILYPFEAAKAAQPYKRQPQIHMLMNLPSSLHPLQLSLEGDISKFRHKADPEKILSFTTGDRYHLIPKISVPIHLSGAKLTPTFAYNATFYHLNRGLAEKTQKADNTRGIIQSSVLLETFFDKNYADFKQSLEPSVYYLYVPYKDQNTYPNFDSGPMAFSYEQLFRLNRFNGYDRIADANRLTLGLSSRLFSHATGEERFRVGIARAKNLDTRKVTLCSNSTTPGCQRIEDLYAKATWDPWTAQVQLTLYNQYFHKTSLEWDPRNKFEKISTSFGYRGPQRGILNLGYEFLRTDIAQNNYATLQRKGLSQSNLSFVWPVSTHVNLLGRWHYDLKKRHSVDTLGGIEYDSCCLAIQAVVSRYLRSSSEAHENTYSSGISLQLIFKGLSKVGINGNERKLSSAIAGYQNYAHRIEKQKS